MQNYRNFSSFHKYIAFGKQQDNLDVSFQWDSAFTKQRSVASLPLVEMLSSLFNVGVAQMRLACYMPLDGDQIKIASKYFQQSAWIFNHLLTLTSRLPASEQTPDFSREALTMCSNLCLAQAQYLFFSKARDNKRKPEDLARVCAQISLYFQQAFECN